MQEGCREKIQEKRMTIIQINTFVSDKISQLTDAFHFFQPSQGNSCLNLPISCFAKISPDFANFLKNCQFPAFLLKKLLLSNFSSKYTKSNRIAIAFRFFTNSSSQLRSPCNILEKSLLSQVLGLFPVLSRKL